VRFGLRPGGNDLQQAPDFPAALSDQALMALMPAWGLLFTGGLCAGMIAILQPGNPTDDPENATVARQLLADGFDAAPGASASRWTIPESVCDMGAMSALVPGALWVLWRRYRIKKAGA
jgi:hypothetical protein